MFPTSAMGIVFSFPSTTPVPQFGSTVDGVILHPVIQSLRVEKEDLLSGHEPETGKQLASHGNDIIFPGLYLIGVDGGIGVVDGRGVCPGIGVDVGPQASIHSLYLEYLRTPSGPVPGACRSRRHPSGPHEKDFADIFLRGSRKKFRKTEEYHGASLFLPRRLA